MEEVCAYCGDELIGEGPCQNDLVYCSQECLDAATADVFDFLDQLEYEDV